MRDYILQNLRRRWLDFQANCSKTARTTGAMAIAESALRWVCEAYQRIARRGGSQASAAHIYRASAPVGLHCEADHPTHGCDPLCYTPKTRSCSQPYHRSFPPKTRNTPPPELLLRSHSPPRMRNPTTPALSTPEITLSATTHKESGSVQTIGRLPPLQTVHLQSSADCREIWIRKWLQNDSPSAVMEPPPPLRPPRSLFYAAQNPAGSGPTAAAGYLRS
jgi:hypothetical protein